MDWSKLKVSADDKLNATEKIKFVYGWVEDIVGKRRKCWEKEKMLETSIFSFSHNVFKMPLS